jgi:hypothetical protein
MPRWLATALLRIRQLAESRRVLFTLKARQELAGLESGLDELDACDVLTRLKPQDFAGRIASAVTGELLYVFKPRVAGAVVYVKVLLRNKCVVVSFHEDQGHAREED